MRDIFNKQLSTLNKELTQMGGAMCEEAIASALKALADNNNDMIKHVIELESEINKQYRNIETLCLQLLLKQQPVASDFRHVSAALKMITDMERIGDQSSDIAEIIPFLNVKPGKKLELIRAMGEAAIKMVTESVDSHVNQNIEMAKKTIADDDIVDNYFAEVKATLIDMIKNNPDEGEYALYLLMIAKYLERIGDHATNIAEWVVYSVTGVHEG